MPPKFQNPLPLGVRLVKPRKRPVSSLGFMVLLFLTVQVAIFLGHLVWLMEQHIVDDLEAILH